MRIDCQLYNIFNSTWQKSSLTPTTATQTVHILTQLSRERLTVKLRNVLRFEFTDIIKLLTSHNHIIQMKFVVRTKYT